MAHEHKVLYTVFAVVPVYDGVSALVRKPLSCILMVAGKNVKVSAGIFYGKIIHGALIVLLSSDVSQDLNIRRIKVVAPSDVDTYGCLFFHALHKRHVPGMKIRIGMSRENELLLQLIHYVTVVFLAGKIALDVLIIKFKHLRMVHLFFGKDLWIGLITQTKLFKYLPGDTCNHSLFKK